MHSINSISQAIFYRLSSNIEIIQIRILWYFITS